MNQSETIIQNVIRKIENLEDLLYDILPKTDKKHREEILDICSLLAQRVEMYLNEYGVNDGVDI